MAGLPDLIFPQARYCTTCWLFRVRFLRPTVTQTNLRVVIAHDIWNNFNVQHWTTKMEDVKSLCANLAVLCVWHGRRGLSEQMTFTTPLSTSQLVIHSHPLQVHTWASAFNGGAILCHCTCMNLLMEIYLRCTLCLTGISYLKILVNRSSDLTWIAVYGEIISA